MLYCLVLRLGLAVCKRNKAKLVVAKLDEGKSSPNRIARERRPKPTPQPLYPSKDGSLAMLIAIRRASSSVSTFAICGSLSFSRE